MMSNDPTTGSFTKDLVTKLRSSCCRMLQGAVFAGVFCMSAVAYLISAVRRLQLGRRLLDCLILQYRRTVSNGITEVDYQSQTQQAAAVSAQNQPFNRTFSYQEAFKVAITSHNAISIEILDGGSCLASSSDDDILEDASLTEIQQAIQVAMDKTDNPIEKLDLFASHFRANLTADMMANILQILPPLKHLQLGGLSLPVQELCQTLAHPSLQDLTHLALYDLVFLGTPANACETAIQTLALEEIVAVFIRLDDHDVSLDPFLTFLQSAPQLRQFELVMDHSHAYLYGYPRSEHLVQRQKVLFSATTFSELLQATSNHLQLLFLEYVPLTTEHYQVMAEHGTSLTQLRLRDDPDIAGTVDDVERLRALASVLRQHESLQTVTLDGLWSSSRQQKQAQEIFQVLPQSTTINSLRLRSLPMQLEELKTLLRYNSTLQSLSLHSINFSACTSLTHQTNVEEEAVFAVLVQILKKHNSTLQRITWKQAEFRRTEVFPRYRKPKPYRYFRQSQQNLNPESAQQQLHWYLTLNQRGIRYTMADLDCPRSDFLSTLAEQQKTPHTQIIGEQAGSQHPQSQGPVKTSLGKCNLNGDIQDDGYALDCLYHMLSNNPSLFC